MGEKLELRLESPVGAEPAVYPWPLPVYVSAARPLFPDPRPSSPTARAEPTEKRSDSSRQTLFGAPLPAPPWFSAAVPAPARRVGRGEPGPAGGADSAAGTPCFRGAPEPGCRWLCRAGEPGPPGPGLPAGLPFRTS